jgi:hypothetical protein
MYADGSTEPFKYYMGDIEDLDVDIVKCCGMDSGTSRETVYYDELMAVYNQLECPLYLVELNARSVGSVVKHINYQDLSGVIQDCGITLNITVLPAQPGAQEPKYSGQQLADIKAKADAAAYAEWKRENADATWIYWFDVY